MNKSKTEQTETVPNATARPPAPTEKNVVLRVIPPPQDLEHVKGFSSFYNQSPIKDSRRQSLTRQSPGRFSLDKSATPVSTTLYANKNNLSQLRTRVITRRKTQYDELISSSMRYNKLLELNNNRSKILTSLNSKTVGQVKIIQLDKRKLQDIYYEVKQHPLPLEGWKPQAREGQVCILYKDYIVLLGGHNNNPLDTICFFSVRDNIWIRSRSFQSDLKRSYHSALLYKSHYIVVFGGMSSYNSYYKTRECLNTCCLVSMNSNPPQLRKIKISNQQIIQPRRCHAAVIIGKHMLVFGGINTKKNYLNDLRTLDLKQLKWQAREYKVSSLALGEYLNDGIAKHCAFTHFTQRQTYPIYSKTYTDKQGVYFFGGCNQYGIESYMLHLNLQSRNPMLSRIQPAGRPPSAVQPIAAHFGKQAVVIISGQRNQREIRLYRIMQMEYVEVIGNVKHLGGIGSSLVSCRDTYYVLFGLGQQGYYGSAVQLQIKEKYKDKPNRRKGVLGDDLKVSFFHRFEDESEGDSKLI